MENKDMYENMSDDVINDIISRVCVQLEPELTQQLMMVFGYANYKYEKLKHIKYLIISTYDSCYDWEVKINDKSICRYDYEMEIEKTELDDICIKLMYDMLDETEIPLENYDFVVLCTDGSVQILKDVVNR